jgi:hypothetical protein
MDGVILHDYELRIGWGKMISLPAIPQWPGPGAGVPLPSVTPAHHGTGFSAPLGAAVPPPPLLAGGATAAMPWSSGAERKEVERGLHDVSCTGQPPAACFQKVVESSTCT